MMAGTQDCRFTQPGMWTKRLCLGPLVRSARNSSLTAVRFTPSGQLAISLFFASATVVEGGKVSSMVCASAKKNLTRKSIFAAALAGALNAGPSRRPGRRSQVRDGKYRSATAREEPWLPLLPAPVPPASRSATLPRNHRPEYHQVLPLSTAASAWSQAVPRKQCQRSAWEQL